MIFQAAVRRRGVVPGVRNDDRHAAGGAEPGRKRGRMSLDFRELCEQTSEVANGDSGEFRYWMYSLLASIEARASLFDETMPDRAARARLRRRSALARRLGDELRRWSSPRDLDLDLVGAIVSLLTEVLELKKRIDLDPEHALAAGPLLRAVHESLNGLYRLMLGLPEDEGSRMRSANG